MSENFSILCRMSLPDDCRHESQFVINQHYTTHNLYHVES